MFAKADAVTLKIIYILKSRRAGSSGFGTEAIMIMIVAALAAVMGLARDAIGALIQRGIAMISGA
jgi:hypothetical protein